MENVIHSTAHPRGEYLATELETWIPLYESKLLKLAFGVLGDIHLAQDCVQEAFIRAGLNAHQLKDPSKMDAWLAKVVINQCRRQLRTRWFQRVRQGTVPDIAHVDREPAGLSPVHMAVRKLPERQRIAVALYYYQDLPIKTVSEIMGIREGTCKAMLHDARRNLQSILEGEAR